MRFTLRQLRTFSALAQTQHFGRAADLLKISQPMVSHDLRSLEQALGVKLFDRSRAGTKLTDDGRALLEATQCVLEASTNLAELAQQLSRQRIVVRFGVTPSLVNRLVPAVLAEIDRKRTGLSIDLIEVATGGVEDLLTLDQADLVAGHFVSPPRRAMGSTLGQDEIWVVSGAGRFDPNHPVKVSDLSGLKLLVWPREQNPRYYDYLVGLLHGSGIDPDVWHGAERVSGAYSFMLSSGQAYSLVPKDYALEVPRSLSAAPLDPVATIPLQVAWQDPPASGVADVVRTILQVRRIGRIS